MPWTLWRYIFLETARLVLIATVVLVAVIAFAATVKPLADGKLTAVQAITFMFFAVPPMLAYALPFAAGFGTTLAYHRLADDNEITAAKAGGLSHARLLIPALALGLTLAGSLAVLNDQIIPRFLTRMERLITQDFTQIMVRELATGEAATFDGAEIHADNVLERQPSPSSPYEKTYLLQGVAAIETNKQGDVSFEVTAPRAWLLLFRAASMTDNQGLDPDQLIARIHFDQGQSFQDGQFIELNQFTTRAYPVPSAFDDDPKFLTGAQLRELKNNPESMSFIESRRMDLARSVATAQLVGSLTSRAESINQLAFNAPAGRTLILNTQALDWNGSAWNVQPIDPADRVRIEEIAPDGSVTRSSALRAQLIPQVDAADPLAPAPTGSAAALLFTLELEDILVGTSTGDTRFSATTQVAQETIENLTVENDPMAELGQLSATQLLDRAATYAEQPDIKRRAETLADRLAELYREVLSKQHERYAMAAACLVMVLTGATLALKLKDQLPLIVYLWSFFPALITIILIASGQSVTHDLGTVGLPLLWSGVAALAAYTVVAMKNLAAQ